jgi:hypothetical protein
VAFPLQFDKHLNAIRIEVGARRSLPLHLFQQRDAAFALADSHLNRFNLVGHDSEKPCRSGSIQFDLMRLGAIT